MRNRTLLPSRVRAPSRKSRPSAASIHSTTKRGSGGAQGRPRTIYKRSVSDSEQQSDVQAMPDTRPARGAPRAPSHSVRCDSTIRPNHHLGVVDRRVLSRPSQLALNLGQPRDTGGALSEQPLTHCSVEAAQCDRVTTLGQPVARSLS